MELYTIFDFFLSLDHYLPALSQSVGAWVYGILFLVIFLETAFVVMLFLPGDSLLIATGTLCATTHVVKLDLIIPILILAAALGYIVNYEIGRWFGHRFSQKPPRWLKRDYLNRTQIFFNDHGGKAIMMARFVPFVRSFAPFAAGSSRMNYAAFMLYNIIGSIVWITVLVGLGYLLGSSVLMLAE